MKAKTFIIALFVVAILNVKVFMLIAIRQVYARNILKV
jgi:hypothetical protein